jgi:uncharacterized protein
MTDFRDDPHAQRYQQGFEGGEVFADYAVRGDARVILHVEADPELRGTGAAGRFMQNMAEHARKEGLTLQPRCAYAVAWLKRHPEFADVTGA